MSNFVFGALQIALGLTACFAGMIGFVIVCALSVGCYMKRKEIKECKATEEEQRPKTLLATDYIKDLQGLGAETRLNINRFKRQHRRSQVVVMSTGLQHYEKDTPRWCCVKCNTVSYHHFAVIAPGGGPKEIVPYCWECHKPLQYMQPVRGMETFI